MIPGADILADVAAEDLAADGRAEFFGDGAALLDGEVGDAAGGVHLARGDEGVGGAGVDAAACRCRSGRRPGWAALVGGDLERGEDAAEEEPRAELLIEDAGVLAGPADAGVAGETRSMSGPVST